MRFNKFYLFFLLVIGFSAMAEQGCPPGQYPIGGQGVAACAPIPQENSTQQKPRASGKWIKTWGAIASDGGDNLGVAKGKLKKSDAQEEALSRCKSLSGKECQVDFVYENQCTAIAEPYKNESAISGVLSYTGGPTIDVASNDALVNCKKHNKGSDCRVIYQACSEPYFQKY